MITPEINAHYQHRYGGLYIAKEVAISSVDKSKWVVYKHVYPFEYETWIRPYDEWCDGRFRQIVTIGELNVLLSKDREEFKVEIGKARAEKR